MSCINQYHQTGMKRFDNKNWSCKSLALADIEDTLIVTEMI